MLAGICRIASELSKFSSCLVCTINLLSRSIVPVHRVTVVVSPWEPVVASADVFLICFCCPLLNSVPPLVVFTFKPEACQSDAFLVPTFVESFSFDVLLCGALQQELSESVLVLKEIAGHIQSPFI